MLTWAGGLPSYHCAADLGVQAVWLPVLRPGPPNLIPPGCQCPQYHGVNLGGPRGWPCSPLLLGSEYQIVTPRKSPTPAAQPLPSWSSRRLRRQTSSRHLCRENSNLLTPNTPDRKGGKKSPCKPAFACSSRSTSGLPDGQAIMCVDAGNR